MATEHSHDPDHGDCIRYFERLSAYIDRELDAVTCADIERHAADCVACQACIATLKQTVALCRQMAGPPAPEALSKRLKQWVAQLTANTVNSGHSPSDIDPRLD